VKTLNPVLLRNMFRQPRQKIRSHKSHPLAVILVVAVLLRVAAVFVLSAPVGADTHEFGDIAKNILSGHGFSFQWVDGNDPITSAHMPPFYPVFLLGLYWLFGVESELGFRVMQTLQIAVSVGSILLVGGIVAAVFGNTARTAGLWIAAVYPAFAYMPSQASSATFTMAAVLLTIYFAIRTVNGSSSVHAAIFGLSAGAYVLLRGEAILFVALLSIWFVRKVQTKHILILTAAVVFIATISPWLVRNTIVFGEIVPVTTSAGVNLWRGNSPYSTGYGEGNIILLDYEVNLNLKAIPVSPQYELDRSAYLIRQTLEHALSHPLDAIKLVFAKFRYYVGWIPDNSLSSNPAYLAGYLPLLVLSILSAVRYWANSRHKYVLLSYLVFSISWPVVFFVIPRYRLFTELILVVLAAPFVAEIFVTLRTWLASRRRNPTLIE
jgi:hypothetical protein